MSSSFLSLYTSGEDAAQKNERPFASLVSRADALRLMGEEEKFDLVVVGGGLTGVTVARDATLQGCRVLLLESGYFGERGSAWRESIAQMMWANPWRLIRTIRSLKAVTDQFAPHLVTFRVDRRTYADGLRHKILAWRLHRAWGKRPTSSETSLPGLTIPDIDERGLIREVVLAARQEGAIALTAVVPSFVERDYETGAFRIGVRDLLGGESVEILGDKLFVDPTFSQPLVSRLGTPMAPRQSSGSASVAVVCAVEARVKGDVSASYQSFELSNGSIGILSELESGVVEVSVLPPSQDAHAVMDVVREICEASGWQVVREISRRSAIRNYSQSVRVTHKRGLLLAEARVPWDSVKISRKVLSQVAADGLTKRMRRPLPGEWREGEPDAFIAAARSATVSEVTIERALQRWKGRVRYIPLVENGFREVCQGVLYGEIVLAVLSDQVTSLEDLIFGSLGIHLMPNWRECVPALAEALSTTESLTPSAINIERSLAVMST